MPDSYTVLHERLAEIHDLGRAGALLAWDERTKMPPRGAEARAEQLATLAAVRHRMFCADEIGRLLDRVRAETKGEPADSDRAALATIVGRDWQKARRVPEALRAEMARASAIAEHAWIEAKRESDFAALLPHLQLNVELLRRFADCYQGFEDFSHPYDPLLDEFEPGMRTHQMRDLLADLREGLVPLVREISQRPQLDDSCLRGEFPTEAQRELILQLLAELPLEQGAWRLDPTEHPFATAIGQGDLRITTRYDEDYLPTALFGALHEAGHALYDAGVDPALERTPLGRPRSLGVHESQSRLWENWVGRSRPYALRLHPRLREAFPRSFDGASPEDLYLAANRVEPSLIRVEADEVTYNLHILLRFELELEIVEEKVELSDLPEAWNARTERYLGLPVPDDAHGVLQDVHWAAGSIGYFPTYSLGNVIAGQLWEEVLSELPELPRQVGAGELTPLREWLRDRVHRHGRKLTPAEILERAGCGPLSVDPLLAHLRSKYGELYGGDPGR
jgi:carboxypeptidase Taq